MLCFLATSLSAGDAVVVPSGQVISLTEVLIDEAPGEPWARFRFVAPGIAHNGGSVGYETAAKDIEDLCQKLAIPYLSYHQISVARIVVSLSDRDVPFGTTDTEATQYFEAFRPVNDLCVWEEF